MHMLHIFNSNTLIYNRQVSIFGKYILTYNEMFRHRSFLFNLVAGLCHFVFSRRKNATQNDEKTPCERTKKKKKKKRHAKRRKTR